MKKLILKCGNSNCELFNKENVLDLDRFIFKFWDIDLHQMQTFPNILDFSVVGKLQCIKCFWQIDAEIRDVKINLEEST